MSTVQIIAAFLALVGAAIAVIGTIATVVSMQRRTYFNEKAPVKGSPVSGVIWSFTTGMLPWKKESARLHWVAYLRGIILHIGIFIGAAFLIASPWLAAIPAWLLQATAAVLITAAVMGLAGFWLRRHDPIMRDLSTPDDYFSLGLTTLFLASGALAAISPGLVPPFWAASGITMAYVPFGKLRHFIYFLYTRAFLGLVFGRRGVLE